MRMGPMGSCFWPEAPPAGPHHRIHLRLPETATRAPMSGLLSLPGPGLFDTKQKRERGERERVCVWKRGIKFSREKLKTCDSTAFWIDCTNSPIKKFNLYSHFILLAFFFLSFISIYFLCINLGLVSTARTKPKAPFPRYKGIKKGEGFVLLCPIMHIHPCAYISCSNSILTRLLKSCTKNQPRMCSMIHGKALSNTIHIHHNHINHQISINYLVYVSHIRSNDSSLALYNILKLCETLYTKPTSGINHSRQ